MRSGCKKSTRVSQGPSPWARRRFRSEHSLRTYYVLGTFPGERVTAANETDAILDLVGFTVPYETGSEIRQTESVWRGRR